MVAIFAFNVFYSQKFGDPNFLFQKMISSTKIDYLSDLKKNSVNPKKNLIPKYQVYEILETALTEIF
jgi:hypothetical protein